MAQSEVKWLSIKLTGRITNSSLSFARSLRLSYIQLAALGQGNLQIKPWEWSALAIPEFMKVSEIMFGFP